MNRSGIIAAPDPVPRVNLDDLPTPCALVDAERLDRNPLRMAAHLASLGTIESAWCKAPR